MVEIINKNRPVNIITVEDPIEYLFSDNKAIISQRQIEDDVSSFAGGLKGALRQDPNVILVGEMRDRETMHMALQAAETGHLVISTSHTLNATETVNRIISTFPLDQENQIRKQLSTTLAAVICQRLIENIDKTGLVPATEIMIATEYIRTAIADPEKTSDIPRIIEMNRIYGMQTFDQSLMDLYEGKLISLEKAREYATHPDDLLLKVKGVI
jgi:twitching motility protein PilT